MAPIAEPVDPPITSPRLTIASPTPGQTVDDSTVVISGIAESPGDIAAIMIHSVNMGGQTQVLNGKAVTFAFRKEWSDTITRKRYAYSATIKAPRGVSSARVELDYRLPGTQAEPHYLNDSVQFRVYRRPRLRIENNLADTLFQRGLTLQVSMWAIDSAPRLEVLIDGGTPNALRVTASSGETGLIRTTLVRDTLVWNIDIPDTLASGSHALLLRLHDEMGIADTLAARFVTHVQPKRYSVTALPGLSGPDSDALDVNASGQVAGWAMDATGATRAVLWTNDVVARLPTSTTTHSSQALALNATGETVGFVNDTSGAVICMRAIRWRNATWEYAGVGGDPCGQKAMDINAGGDIVVDRLKNVFYLPGSITGWIVRAGVATAFLQVVPADINDAGILVGRSFQSYGDTYYYGPKSIPPRFRPPSNGGHPGGAYVGINNQAQLLGSYAESRFFTHTPGVEATDLNPYLANATLVRLTQNGAVLAFDEPTHTAYFWRANRTSRVTLATPGWRLDKVTGMNDNGRIVGHATELVTGRTAAVALDPLP